MMRTDPAGVEPCIALREMTAASDMHRLPAQREVEGEGCPRAGISLDANLASVLLNNPVGHREPKASAAILSFFRRGLRGKERVVDAMHMLGRNAGAGVGAAHADLVAIARRDAERAATWHGVFGIQEQIQE